MKNVPIVIITILLSSVLLNGQGQQTDKNLNSEILQDNRQSKSISKVLKDIEKQKVEIRKKSRRIEELEGIISQLINEKSNDGKEKGRLKQEILEYTNEVLKLRSQLVDAKAKYSNLLEQISLLKAENEDYKYTISVLQGMKDSLENRLSIANRVAEKISIELDSANLREERLKIENQSLIKTINRIRSKTKFIGFGEGLISMPGVIGANISGGFLVNGRSLYLGLNTGFIEVNRRPSFRTERDNAVMSMIPITIQARYALSKTSGLEPRYLNRDIPLFGFRVPFVSIEAGAGINTRTSGDSDYNLGGFRTSIGGGVMVSPNESINAYIFLGLDFQTVQRNSSINAEDKIKRLGGLRLNVGFNF